MASSSSTINVCEDYDVFLSFRGDDTRYNFTSHLYEALRRNNIKVFIDYNIRRGKEITLAIERVIEGAKMSIIVFSKNYAESTFCLDELLKIMECRESKTQIVLPIFYKVEPLEEIYQEAFTRHEQTIKQLIMVERLKSFLWKALNCATYCLAFGRYEDETIKQERTVETWKSAFRKALELAGVPINDKCNEAERIEKITCEVLANLKELNSSLYKGEELICTSLVGQTAENNFKKIWKCLMNDKISRVGIYGMGGVGKTTIATRINNELLASANAFTQVCWVTVSKVLSIYKLQNDVAKMINLDLSKEDDERKRAAKLRINLKTKKFVLILDDVWEAFEIEDVGIPPLVEGQKLLLTSRSRRVCEMMECQLIEVKPLSEQEALDLFVKESKYQRNDSLEWRKILHSIVRECAGLPLAIVVVARRMKGVKEISIWRNTLRELQKPCERENNEIEKKVYKVLKFSYDCLPSDKYRQCFLYCSLFPEDHKFERNGLIEYWIGERLIDELDSRQAELDKGNAILNELIHSSLLEKNDKSFNIKMHDVIRDMARINVKVGLQFEDPLKSVKVMNETMLKSFPNSALHCSKLRTLLLREYVINFIMELPGYFFANMQSLTILDMRSVEIIPESLTNLENLRVLIIYDCHDLKSIPYLGGLEKLQHLRISGTFLKEIPKGMERLVNLRVLNLSMNLNLGGSISSGLFEKLSLLQTLDLEDSRVEVELEALISLEKLETLKVHFKDLHKLNSYVKSGHWRRLVDYRIHYGLYEALICEKGMSLDAIRDVEEWKGESGIFLPDDIQHLKLVNWKSSMFYVLKNPTFANLRLIHISNYKSRYLFTVDVAQWLLHNVEELFIAYNGLEEIIATEEECANQSNYINHPIIVLPKLKIVSLCHQPELTSIYSGRMVCPSLEFIKIYRCDKLERLPFCMEEKGNQQNYSTIHLQGVPTPFENLCPVSRRWWDSLKWDDPNAKLIYRPIFSKK